MQAQDDIHGAPRESKFRLRRAQLMPAEPRVGLSEAAPIGAHKNPTVKPLLRHGDKMTTSNKRNDLASDRAYRPTWHLRDCPVVGPCVLSGRRNCPQWGTLTDCRNDRYFH
jgi:hypothetical protein